jgi:hypothetical protein
LVESRQAKKNEVSMMNEKTKFIAFKTGEYLLTWVGLPFFILAMLAMDLSAWCHDKALDCKIRERAKMME